MKKLIPIILIVSIFLGSFMTPAGVKVANAQNTDQTSFKSQINGCGIGDGKDTFGGCVLQYIAYPVLVSVPSFLLGVVAKFFDYMTMLTLDSAMYDKSFIPTIWKTIRDFANIFFILILLYAAIQMILGLGHDPRKIVAQVIIIALLINFSLFFTKVVIDASNIVALIFYTRIDTQGTPPEQVSTYGEKPIAGTLVGRFNINQVFTEKTINEAKKDGGEEGGRLNFSRALTLMFIYAIIVFPLMYAFIIAGLSFLGRIITLIMLMILSPVAFISYAVPSLRNKNMIGFDSWLHKLLETSFVAAIFIFIIYVVATILKNSPFTDLDPTKGIFALFLSILIPALLIIIMILKGAKYAKEASGEFTGAVFKGAGMLAGGIMGAGAMVATGGVGAATAALRGTSAGRSLVTAVEKRVDNKGLSGWAARKVMAGGAYTQKASFDLRKAPGLGSVAKSAGIDLGAASAIGLGVKEGGFKAREEAAAKKKLKEAELYKTNLSKKEDILAASGGRFSTAEELNHHRLEEFKKRIGIDGLLGAAVYSGVSRAKKGASEEDIVESTRNWKRGIGLGLGTAAGVATGGIAAGGLMGAAVGGGAGFVGTGVYGGYQRATEQKTEKDVDKKLKKEGDIEKKMHEAKEAIKKEDELIAAIKAAGNPGGIIISAPNEDGEMKAIPATELIGDHNEVRKDKIEEYLAAIEFEEKKVNSKLNSLNDKIVENGGTPNDAQKAQMGAIREEFKTLSKEKAKLNNLKTSPDRRDKAEQTMDRMKEKEEKMHEKEHAEEHKGEHKSGGGGNAESHSAPAAPAPSGGGGAHPPSGGHGH